MNTIASTIRRTVLAVIALVIATSTMTAAQAPSPQPGSGQALEIGPPIINLKGDPGQTLKAQISLRDASNDKLIVSNQINDFTAGGEDGTPKLLLNNEDAGPNSIIPWISPLPEFTLSPKQIQKLDLTVKIPANAAPGGYYGVIRFTGRPPGIDGTGVALSASVGALVFVRVNGDAKESLTIEEFTTVNPNGKSNWLFEAPPVNFAVRVKNTGNTFERPTGKVVVKDMYGNNVGLLNVNQNESTVLPNTIRKYTQPLDKDVIGNKFLFGKYTAELTMTYGESGQTVKSNLEFWVVPYRLIAAIIIGLIALFLLVRFALLRYRDRLLGNTRHRGGGRRR